MVVNLHIYNNYGMYMDTKCIYIANVVDAIRSTPIFFLSDEVVSSMRLCLYIFSNKKNFSWNPLLLNLCDPTPHYIYQQKMLGPICMHNRPLVYNFTLI